MYLVLHVAEIILTKQGKQSVLVAYLRFLAIVCHTVLQNISEHFSLRVCVLLSISWAYQFAPVETTCGRGLLRRVLHSF